MTLPPYQTACGCTDILMHTMERYFNHSENMELTDGIQRSTDAHGDQKCKNPCKRAGKL